MSKSLMYHFVSDKRPNPLGGDCYKCKYCYIHGIRGMKIRFEHIRNKYSGDFELYPNALELMRNIKSDKPVFFCDCIDYMHKDNPVENVERIFWYIKNNKYDTQFLSLTKNPARYIELIKYIPENVILGTTIESNMIYPEYSNAPYQNLRIQAMNKLNLTLEYLRMRNKTFISIEPILKFTHKDFVDLLDWINPTFGIAIGYDNHHNKLHEPSFEDTLNLRRELIKKGYRIIDKTLKKAWWED